MSKIRIWLFFLLCILVPSSVYAAQHHVSRSGNDANNGSNDQPFKICEGDSDTHTNFNAYWGFFDEQYALFDVRLPNSSWNELGEQACDKINAAIYAKGEVTDHELFDLLIDLAEYLDDGHITLEADNIRLEDDAWINEYIYEDELGELEGNIEENYINEDEFSTAAEEEFSWGTIDDVGYLSITSMSELAPDSDPDATDQDDHTIDDKAADAAMRAVMNDLGDVAGMIIDVRANEGGWDTVSLVISSWFNGSRTVAWSEQRRDGPGHLDFGSWEDTYVEAAKPNAYGGPVVLLTSGGTFSAAEVFVLAMRVRDNITVMGEPTSGHFSDQLARTLPNGWIVNLSNERYRAADGEIYEARGAPVDVPVALDVEAVRNDEDAMLEEALRQLAD